jgi:flagellin
VSDGQSSTLSGIKVESAANAGHAIESLDKALEEVSSSQAKLGAIQNRLQHNIDNLSKSSMLTEQSVGRVVDADFATETSNLSKQQILNQAATAMLAQANQSKQSVLSLLQ